MWYRAAVREIVWLRALYWCRLFSTSLPYATGIFHDFLFTGQIHATWPTWVWITLFKAAAPWTILKIACVCLSLFVLLFFLQENPYTDKPCRMHFSVKLASVFRSWWSHAVKYHHLCIALPGPKEEVGSWVAEAAESLARKNFLAAFPGSEVLSSVSLHEPLSQVGKP